jgi:glycosyltransferase involved in cell wall biosynthesis
MFINVREDKRMICKVSLGLPVYNGEPFLRESIESILAQTFSDFELIICDNGSTDLTSNICREYSAFDDRVRYFKYEKNRGVVWNHNRVFELSSGKYFKWCGADDIIAPFFISSCVKRLEGDLMAVLCYSNASNIDQEGIPLQQNCIRDEAEFAVAVSSLDAVTRFSFLLSSMDRAITPFYGLIRSAVLRRPRPLGDFLASDRCLLAELSLLGTFLRIPERLFSRRTDLRVMKNGTDHEILLYKPRQPPRFVVRELRVAVEHVLTVQRAPLRWDIKLRLVLVWLRWLARTRNALKQETKELLKCLLRVTYS